MSQVAKEYDHRFIRNSDEDRDFDHRTTDGALYKLGCVTSVGVFESALVFTRLGIICAHDEMQ